MKPCTKNTPGRLQFEPPQQGASLAVHPQPHQLPQTTPSRWIPRPTGLVPLRCQVRAAVGCAASTLYLCALAFALPWGPITAHGSQTRSVGLTAGPPVLTTPLFGCLAAVREQDMSPQLLQKFKELIPIAGLNKDMLVVLPKSGECQGGAGRDARPLCVGTLRGGSGRTHPLCLSTDQCSEAIR